MVDAGCNRCWQDDGGFGHEIIVRGAGDLGRWLEFRMLAIAERSKYALKDCGIEFAWSRVNAIRVANSERGGDSVPQPKKVIFVGIVSTDILVLR